MELQFYWLLSDGDALFIRMERLEDKTDIAPVDDVIVIPDFRPNDQPGAANQVFINSSKTSPGREAIKQLLHKEVKVVLADDRVIIGSFFCTDRDCNIVLGGIWVCVSIDCLIGCCSREFWCSWVAQLIDWLIVSFDCTWVFPSRPRNRLFFLSGAREYECEADLLERKREPRFIGLVMVNRKNTKELFVNDAESDERQ